MSHDIRTPINGICGMVNMADHYADDIEKQTEYRTKVKEASNLLLELVNDVLDMSKLESGEIVLEEVPFNLSSISRRSTCCDRADGCRTEYSNHVGEKRNHTSEFYWKPGVCETCDDEYPVQCGEI